MIKSLTFTGEFGYITGKIEEPICPVRGYTEGMKNPRYVNEKEKEQLKQWKKEHNMWKKHKDDYANPHLVKNLLNRKFEFEEG